MAAFPLSVYATSTVVALAAMAQSVEPTWHVTRYVSRWANTDPLEVSERSIIGGPSFEKCSFVDADLASVIVPALSIFLPGTDFSFRSNRIEIEGQSLRHFGRHSLWEGMIALMFRIGQISLVGGLRISLAAGEGLSFASEKADLGGSFRVEPTRLLNYPAFKAEFSHSAVPGV